MTSKVFQTARLALAPRLGLLLPLAAAVCIAGLPAYATAQNVGGRNEVFAGSELESYLRYLQTLGKSKDSIPGAFARFRRRRSTTSLLLIRITHGQSVTISSDEPIMDSNGATFARR
jgi:hypothetical protein